MIFFSCISLRQQERSEMSDSRDEDTQNLPPSLPKKILEIVSTEVKIGSRKVSANSMLKAKADKNSAPQISDLSKETAKQTSVTRTFTRKTTEKDKTKTFEVNNFNPKSENVSLFSACIIIFVLMLLFLIDVG